MSGTDSDTAWRREVMFQLTSQLWMNKPLMFAWQLQAEVRIRPIGWQPSCLSFPSRPAVWLLKCSGALAGVFLVRKL